MILVDTSIWIESTRQKDGVEAAELDGLLSRDEVATTDMVIAEVLQGTASEGEFDRYSNTMASLHYFPITRDVWIQAARLSFRLRRRGLATPLPDLLIAQVALENELPIYTIDSHFGRIPNLQLYLPTQASPDATL